jgi:hypothetical protein
MTPNDKLRREIRQIINLLRLYGRKEQHQNKFTNAWTTYRNPLTKPEPAIRNRG